MFGLITYNFSINCIVGDDSPEKLNIGQLSIIKADFSSEDFDSYMILDLSGRTESYSFFVDEYGISDETVEFYNLMNGLEICEKVMFIIDRIEIEEQYRSNNLGLIAIKTAIKALNLNYSPFGIFLNPFPLQFENYKSDDMRLDEKDFKKAQRKLIKYYKQIGFIDKVPFKADTKFMFANSMCLL